MKTLEETCAEMGSRIFNLELAGSNHPWSEIPSGVIGWIYSINPQKVRKMIEKERNNYETKFYTDNHWT